MNLDPQTWQLETERLILRAPQLGDGAILNAAVRESFAQLSPWMPWAREIPSVGESEDYTRRALDLWQRGERYDVRVWRRDGVFVGSSGFSRFNLSVPMFEIGYWCRTSLAGQGFTSEVVRALANYAFSELSAQRVEIRCDARNLASRRVAEKCGFALEAVLHHAQRDNAGELCDFCVYTRFPAS